MVYTRFLHRTLHGCRRTTLPVTHIPAVCYTFYAPLRYTFVATVTAVYAVTRLWITWFAVAVTPVAVLHTVPCVVYTVADVYTAVHTLLYIRSLRLVLHCVAVTCAVAVPLLRFAHTAFRYRGLPGFTLPLVLTPRIFFFFFFCRCCPRTRCARAAVTAHGLHLRLIYVRGSVGSRLVLRLRYYTALFWLVHIPVTVLPCYTVCTLHTLRVTRGYTAVYRLRFTRLRARGLRSDTTHALPARSPHVHYLCVYRTLPVWLLRPYLYGCVTPRSTLRTPPHRTHLPCIAVTTCGYRTRFYRWLHPYAALVHVHLRLHATHATLGSPPLPVHRSRLGWFYLFHFTAVVLFWLIRYRFTLRGLRLHTVARRLPFAFTVLTVWLVTTHFCGSHGCWLPRLRLVPRGYVYTALPHTRLRLVTLPHIHRIRLVGYLRLHAVAVTARYTVAAHTRCYTAVGPYAHSAVAAIRLVTVTRVPVWFGRFWLLPRCVTFAAHTVLHTAATVARAVLRTAHLTPFGSRLRTFCGSHCSSAVTGLPAGYCRLTFAPLRSAVHRFITALRLPPGSRATHTTPHTVLQHYGCLPVGSPHCAVHHYIHIGYFSSRYHGWLHTAYIRTPSHCPVVVGCSSFGSVTLPRTPAVVNIHLPHPHLVTAHTVAAYRRRYALPVAATPHVLRLYAPLRTYITGTVLTTPFTFFTRFTTAGSHTTTCSSPVHARLPRVRTTHLPRLHYRTRGCYAFLPGCGSYTCIYFAFPYGSTFPVPLPCTHGLPLGCLPVPAAALLRSVYVLRTFGCSPRGYVVLPAGYGYTHCGWYFNTAFAFTLHARCTVYVRTVAVLRLVCVLRGLRCLRLHARCRSRAFTVRLVAFCIAAVILRFAITRYALPFCGSGLYYVTAHAPAYCPFTPHYTGSVYL